MNSRLSLPYRVLAAAVALLLAGCGGDAEVAPPNDAAAMANSPYAANALPPSPVSAPPQPASVTPAETPTVAEAPADEEEDEPELLVPGPSHELLPIPQPKGPREVGVRFIEYEIQVTRDTVQAGEVTFIVVNAGKTTHWLVVRNDSTFADTGHIQPGETAVLRMDLKPGDYYLVCTIRDEYDHISEGERRPFTVR